MHDAALGTAAALLLVTLGCGGAETKTTTKTTTAQVVDAGVVIQEIPEPKPLPPKDEIQVVADDGAVLNGYMFASADRQARLRADDGAIVLLHGFGFAVEEASDLIADLQLNYTVISIDLRGHGDSNFFEDGTPIDRESLGPKGWSTLAMDVRAAVGRARDLNPPPAAVSLVAAGLGGSAALIFAASDDEIFAVAALSPRADSNVDPTKVANKLKKSQVALFYAAKDKPSATLAAKLKRGLPGGALVRYPGRGQGARIGGTMWKDVLAFLSKTPARVELKPVNADD